MSTVWDKLDDDSMYDGAGKALPPVVEGEPGTSAPPDPASTAAAVDKSEDTAATQPSPDAKPAPATSPATEDKSGQPPAVAKDAEPGKTAAPADDPAKAIEGETEDALRTRLSKPGDTGEEWRIRAFREGEKLRKQLGPIQERVERIASPDRVARGLDFVEVFAEPDKPIAEAVAKMTALSSSRAQELNDHYYNTTLDTYPDQVASDLLGETATVEELKEGLKLLRGGAGRETTQPQSTAAPATPLKLEKPEGMSDDAWQDFLDDPDFAPVRKRMEQELAAKQQQAAPPEAPKTDPKLDEVTQKLKAYEEQERQRVVESHVAEIDTEARKFHSEAFSVVEDGLRDLGLVIDPAKDDARTQTLKTRTANTIRENVEKELDGPDGPEGEMDWSLCNEQQKENRKLAMTIFGLFGKKDFAAARDYLDIAKARYDLAFQKVADAEVELYNAAMLQPTTKTRDVADAGTRRPELIDGAAASGLPDNANAKTPWLDPGFRMPGESSFEAMERYLDSHDGLPGR